MLAPGQVEEELAALGVAADAAAGILAATQAASLDELEALLGPAHEVDPAVLLSGF